MIVIKSYLITMGMSVRHFAPSVSCMFAFSLTFFFFYASYPLLYTCNDKRAWQIENQHRFCDQRVIQNPHFRIQPIEVEAFLWLNLVKAQNMKDLLLDLHGTDKKWASNQMLSFEFIVEMESNSMVDVPLKKDIKVSSSDNEKVDEHGVSGVYLNEDGEVETPKIGMVFASQEEVRDYYNRYAQRVGFGIMRRSSRCDDDGRLTYIVLSCSQCGKDRGIPKSRFQWKQTSKTNCKAKINLVLNPQGQFHICNVVLDHNHELTPGKLHPNICKKSKSFRTRKGREGKEQAGMMLHQIFGQFLANLWAVRLHHQQYDDIVTFTLIDSVMQRSSFSNHLLNGDKHLLCSYTGLPTGETISNRLKRRSPSLEGSQNSQDSLRQALAKRAVALVKIWYGTGRTLTLVIEEIGKLIQEGKLKDIVAVGTNYQSRITARQYGMTTVDPNDVNDIDIAFDVVDEVDINKNLLKCRGANHTVQKVIDSMAKVCILLVEHSKVVHRLGNNIPVAVEVLPIAVSPVLRRLIALGGVPEIRSASRKDGSVITDLGNMVVDVSFPSGIQNPAELEKNINMIPGVVDNGIFSAVATIVLVVVRDRGNIRVMNLEEFLEGVPGHRDANTKVNVTVEKDIEGRNDKMRWNGVQHPDEVRSYYDEYACHLGFNTIKKSTKSGDDGNVKYFTLACSRSGKELPSASQTNRFNFRKRLPPRTNCKAKLNVTIGPDGRVYVCRVILEHNHELVPGLHGMKKKKSRAPRVKKVGTGQSQVPHSVVHEAGSSANLKSDYAIPRIVTDPNQIIFGSSNLTKRSVNRNVSSGSKRRNSVFANPVLNQESTERILARKAVELVKSGMVIGLGSGTAISMVMEELGRLIREGKLKDIIAVGGNYQSRVDLSGVSKIDIAFDGVDEVDFNKNLLKCGGPAHTMQKVIDSVASECIILVDQPKVEVLPPALTPVLKRLATLGGVPEIRYTSNENGPLFTDLGNMVVDVSFPNGIQNPAELEKNIKLLPGVVENGIVTGVATTVLVAVKERGAVNVVNLEDYVRTVLDRRDGTLTS
ncbi:hypothetical protein NC651_014717 [Populus alba x Populus x berolinensis]|nr:hypothetical protein NC651_014717 [Populus alba x Populus x berolinensis]